MSSVEGEIAERSREWDRAVKERDVQRAGALLHQDFALVLVQPAKTIMSRDQWLALLPDYVVTRWEVLEQVVHADDDVAAVLQRVDMSAAVLDQDRSGIFVLGDIWRRSHGTWQVWRRHSTPLSADELPAMRAQH